MDIFYLNFIIGIICYMNFLVVSGRYFFFFLLVLIKFVYVYLKESFVGF